MMNIYLVGMPGSGKTALGKGLAKKLGFTFMDTDEEVTKIFGKTPEELILNEGEGALRDAEKIVLEKILEEDNLLVATGGGFPIFNQIMDRLNEHGLTIYLSYNATALWRRLMQSHSRPLAKSERELSFLLKRRKPIYEKASIIYKGSKGYKENVDQVIQEIQIFMENEIDPGNS